MLSEEEALDQARFLVETRGFPRAKLRAIRDTSNFYNVDHGDVLILPSGGYLIRGNEWEGRFGLEEQGKPWVKKALALDDGRRKVIKLVFFERFQMKIGRLTYDCYRSPQKESRLLDLISGNRAFMQGFSTYDEKGNNIRVIDHVPGPNLSAMVQDMDLPHEEYFHQVFPGLLDLFRSAVDAIAFLHANGEKHGDVRRDHLIKSRDGHLVWIDFDYNYRHGETIAGMDLFGLGNILAFLVGGGDQTQRQLKQTRPEAFDLLTAEDMSIVFPNRVMNLRKIFPYIPVQLNHVLKHFSVRSDVFYDTARELLDDLNEARTRL